MKKTYSLPKKAISMLLCLLLLIFSFASFGAEKSYIPLSVVAFAVDVSYEQYNTLLNENDIDTSDMSLIPTAVKDKITDIENGIGTDTQESVDSKTASLKSLIENNQVTVTFKARKGNNGSTTSTVEVKKVWVNGSVSAIPELSEEYLSYTSIGDDYEYDYQNQWLDISKNTVTNAEILAMTFSANTVFTAKYNSVFVSADYTAFNEQKTHAQALIDSNELIYDSVDKFEGYFASAFNDGEPYGKAHQNIVDNATEQIRDLILKADQNQDDVVDNETFLIEYPVYFKVNGVTIHTEYVKKGRLTTYDRIEENNPEYTYDDESHYAFDHWDGIPEKVLGECTVIAVFKEGEEHTLVDEVGIKENTCTEDGYTGDTTCSVCGYIETQGDVIPKKEHNHVPVNVFRSEDNTYEWISFECSKCRDFYALITFSAIAEDGSAVAKTDVAVIKNGETVYEGKTNKDGKCVCDYKFADGEYTISLRNQQAMLQAKGKLTVGNFLVSGKYADNGHMWIIEPCDCSCHNDNFFGHYKRWFYTLVSVILQRKVKCCDDMQWYGRLASNLE